MQAGYEHCLPKMNKVDGLRSALIFRQGHVAAVRDTGRSIAETAEAGSDILAPPVALPTIIGHPPPNVVEGRGSYSRADLFISRAHRCDRRGVCGNIASGAESIVVSRQSQELREEDGLEWLKYTSSRRQGGGGFATSYKKQQAIRVFRSSSLNNPFAPPPRPTGTAYRYDGLYRVDTIWDEHGAVTQEGPSPNGAQYTFLLKRLPQTSNGESDGGNKSNLLSNLLSTQQLWRIICESKGTSSCEFNAPEPSLCLGYIPFLPPTARHARVAPHNPGALTLALPRSMQGCTISTGNKTAFGLCSTRASAEATIGAVSPDRLGESVVADDEADVEEGDINWVQCDRCDKWRVLQSNTSETLSFGEWYCELNTLDPQHNSCDAPEQSEESVLKSISIETACDRSGEGRDDDTTTSLSAEPDQPFLLFLEKERSCIEDDVSVQFGAANESRRSHTFNALVTKEGAARWRELSKEERERYIALSSLKGVDPVNGAGQNTQSIIRVEAAPSIGPGWSVAALESSAETRPSNGEERATDANIAVEEKPSPREPRRRSPRLTHCVNRTHTTITATTTDCEGVDDISSRPFITGGGDAQVGKSESAQRKCASAVGKGDAYRQCQRTIVPERNTRWRAAKHAALPATLSDIRKIEQKQAPSAVVMTQRSHTVTPTQRKRPWSHKPGLTVRVLFRVGGCLYPSESRTRRRYATCVIPSGVAIEEKAKERKRKAPTEPCRRNPRRPAALKSPYSGLLVGHGQAGVSSESKTAGSERTVKVFIRNGKDRFPARSRDNKETILATMSSQDHADLMDIERIEQKQAPSAVMMSQRSHTVTPTQRKRPWSHKPGLTVRVLFRVGGCLYPSESRTRRRYATCVIPSGVVIEEKAKERTRSAPEGRPQRAAKRLKC